jgi:hypothetical protein
MDRLHGRGRWCWIDHRSKPGSRVCSPGSFAFGTFSLVESCLDPACARFRGRCEPANGQARYHLDGLSKSLTSRGNVATMHGAPQASPAWQGHESLANAAVPGFLELCMPRRPRCRHASASPEPSAASVRCPRPHRSLLRALWLGSSDGSSSPCQPLPGRRRTLRSPTRSPHHP